MRVAFYNNYDMAMALERHDRGDYAGHHLWGVLALRDRGWELAPFPNERFVRLSTFSGPRFGDLDVQLRVFLDQRNHDVVVSGTEYDTVALGFMRRLSLYRRGIIAVVHGLPRPPFNRPWLTRLAFGNHDRLLFHSSVVRDHFIGLGIDPARTGLLGWGLDLGYYPSVPVQPSAWDHPYVLSAGKTRRDHETLVKGFAGASIDLRLYCSKDSAPPVSVTPPNAHVFYDRSAPGMESEALTDEQLHGAYQGCVAVAVPLAANGALAGLTSQLEGMAMGRAVLITRNPLFDIDVEKERIGIVIEPATSRDGAMPSTGCSRTPRRRRRWASGAGSSARSATTSSASARTSPTPPRR